MLKKGGIHRAVKRRKKEVYMVRLQDVEKRDVCTRLGTRCRKKMEGENW